MTDNPVPGTPSLPEVQARLHDVARLLRESQAIDPQTRQSLAELVDELGAALRSTSVDPAEAAHLAQTAAQLAEALHHRHDQGRLAQVRDRLEQTVLAAEARAPFAAGLVRRLLDALANVGI
jgi:hypothetical protein